MMLFLRSLVANLYFYPAMALGFVVSLPVGVFSRPAMVAMWDKFCTRSSGAECLSCAELR